ncbi:MAG: prepilin-type N-terminal cleavage/methylation domain-containing protein [Armatimonadetes bacterium]|nr:prepilin-type N-terminal cleavage/methylation domain-containing protein [Armatimonadota bacterium]
MLTSRRAAFTLVELLVVIGIIAVLAGILFPVFAHARARGRQTHCAANMRQIHTALVAYSEDHGGLLPQATTKCPGGEFGTQWQGQMDIVWWDFVLPYLGSPKILYCPSVRPTLPAYLINSQFSFLEGRAPDDCTDPTSTVLLVEGRVPDGPGYVLYVPIATGSDPQFDGACFRHSGKMNVCFADGHVKLLGPESLVQGSPLWEVEKPLE